MTPSIAIIGAGPCGLTLARLLERNNIDYVLFERDLASAPRHHKKIGVGGSLDLHPGTGQRVLKVAGLFDEFKKHARYDATGFKVATQNGEIKIHTGEGRDAPEIDRSQLRQMLLDSVSANKIRWDHGVKAVERNECDAGWNVKFANGSSQGGFKLVVGTDGAWSKVRPVLTSSKPVYSGAHFIEGRISAMNPSYSSAMGMAGKGNFVALGSRKWLSVQQMADASYRVYMGALVAEDFTRNIDMTNTTETMRRKFLESHEFFADWSPKLKQIIADAEGPFKPWPLYSLPAEAMEWSHVPGVTLLGDAAHLTTPNGEGVNCAMYDSLVLAEKIVKHCDGGELTEESLDRAVVEYEEDMFQRAREHIEDGNNMIGMMFAQNAVEAWLQMFEAAADGQ